MRTIQHTQDTQAGTLIDMCMCGHVHKGRNAHLHMNAYTHTGREREKERDNQSHSHTHTIEFSWFEAPVNHNKDKIHPLYLVFEF